MLKIANFKSNIILKTAKDTEKSSSRKVAKYLKCLKVLREKLQSFELGILTKFKQIALFLQFSRSWKNTFVNVLAIFSPRIF